MKLLFTAFLALSLLAGCSGQTDKSSPMSVRIKGYRIEKDAKEAVARLKELEVPCYYIAKLGEKNNLWFDLHAGAFKDTNSAQVLAEKLCTLGLKDSEVADYSLFESAVEKYRKGTSEEIREQSSASLTKPFFYNALADHMKLLPKFDTFKISFIRTADVESCGKTGMYKEDIHVETKYVPASILKEAVKNAKYLSVVVFEEKIFANSIAGITASGKDLKQLHKFIIDSYKDRVMKSIDVTAIKDQVPGKLIITKDDELCFTGISTDGTKLVYLKSIDTAKLIFTNLITSEGGIDGYPELLATLSTQPEKNGDMSFAYFQYESISWHYADERNNVPWANHVVGYPSLNAYYSVKNVPVASNLFNLYYKKSAALVQADLLEEKTKFPKDESGQPVYSENKKTEINKCEAYYLKWMTRPVNEFNFARNGYIVFTNSFFNPLKEEEVKAISNTLQIWKEK